MPPPGDTPPLGEPDPDAPEELVAQAVEAYIDVLGDDPDAVAPDVERFAATYPRELRARIVEACRSYLAMRPVLEGARAPDAPSLKRLGHYRVLGLLGSGSMAQVFLAHDERHDRRVALKVMHAHLGSSGVLLERFRREAHVIRSVRSPHVVRIHEIGEHDGRHFIAMELVHGGSLAQDLVRRAEQGEPGWSIDDAARLTRELCHALVAVHARGIIHRDIKPQNILLDEDGHAKLADFGLAQLVDKRRLTLSGQLQGTPYYMSPEQALAKRVDVDHRTDLYSLGVVLYELLTRHRPSEGKTSHQVLYAISFKRPRTPRSLNPKVPVDLETICLKALEKSPDDRFVDAQDMLGDLERQHRDQPIVGRLPSPAMRAWRKLREHGRAVALGALALLALLLAGWAYHRHETARASWPRLSVESALDVPGQQVWGRRIDPVSTELLAPELLGAAPLRRRRVPPGAWRLQLVTPDDALAETTVWLQPDDDPAPVRLHPQPVAPQPPPGMLRVEGATIPVIQSARLHDDGRLEPLPLADAVRVEPFLIDAALVTNGEYLAYLVAHPDAPRPHHWPDEGSDAWAARSPDFDALPLVGLSAFDAQAFARARGARLPSLAEWQLAAQGVALTAFPWGARAADDADDAVAALLERANFAASLPGDVGSDMWRDANERLRPVRDAHPDNVSAAGLLQPLGNTWEFTESPWRDARYGDVPGVQLYIKGPGWASLTRDRVATHGLFAAGLTQHRLPDPISGIRCVRSITPWRHTP